jgi:murein DD-endopeptidase MepM/ murein hydrolase activator NlpD
MSFKIKLFWGGSLVLVFLLLPYFFSFAQTAGELSRKIEEKNTEIGKLELEIRGYQSELEALGKQKASLDSAIKELDLTRKKLNADISVTQKKIDQVNLRIGGLSSQIGSKEELIALDIRAIAESIRQTNELEQTSLLEIIFSDNDFATIWNDLENRNSIRRKLTQTITELEQIKVELEDTREESIAAKNELEALRSKLADQRKIVEQNATEKNKLLSQTKSSEANYQKILAEQLAKKLAFERELREFESQLQFILDPSKLPGPGVLSWPLDEIFITQEFGAKTGPHRTYASGHSGTDFRARTPLPTYAMADGVVKGIGDTDLACLGASFGKWIFVEYNNGLSSTHAHLSLIKVTEGQSVRRGEIVGYTGGTGRVTGPHLHISLYVSSAVRVDTVPSVSCPGRILKQPIAAINAYLDPMYYLPARR